MFANLIYYDKNKVDQYIKLFSMGKAFEILNPLGGEKKNDV